LKYQQQRGSSCNVWGRKEKKKEEKKLTYDKPNHHHLHASLQQENDTKTLLTIWWKDIFGFQDSCCSKCADVSNMPSSVGHVPDFFLFCLYTYSQIPIASKPTWTKNHGEIDKKNPLRLVLILISNSILVISL
jgi:hypothetical protein